MDLTVLVPGIRCENWRTLYDSIGQAFSGKWEMIIISPYELPDNMQRDNVRWIQDWGAPMRCMQQGLCGAHGDWITWAADDGKFVAESLDIGFSKLAKHDFDPNYLVMGKYIEGGNDGDMSMQDNSYYLLGNHDATKIKYVPKDCYMLNVGLVSRELLFKMGGWDCRFEVCPMAFNDLAIRLHQTGVKWIIQDEIMFTCSHMPGKTGDHAPIHDGQIDHDQPLFREIWQCGASQGRDVIKLDNWKKSPEKWRRRFN